MSNLLAQRYQQAQQTLDFVCDRAQQAAITQLDLALNKLNAQLPVAGI